MSELGIMIQRGGFNQNKRDIEDLTKQTETGEEKKRNYYRFFLQADNIAISHNRTPIVSSLPGSDPILLDLGQWTVDLKIEGTADIPIYISSDTKNREKKTNSIPVADKDDLEFIASPELDGNSTLSWYDKDICIVDYTKARYGHIKKTIYLVKVSGMSLNKRDVNNYYDFVLTASGYLIPKK